MVDYSYYLGKDYEYRYDRAGIFVFNHINCFDTLHQLYLNDTAKSFIAKKEILNFPLLSLILKPYELVLVGRDTKDSPQER
jgi:1-acyl-sn-glycerol-3-phosphate acyltransferase